MDRTILHCDCNGFYASVEMLFAPELRQVPMAVCGNPKNRHGIILAKNELAKSFGIQTAETVWQAMQKCPELTLVLPRRDAYSRYSRLVNEIYQEYTDRVEPFSIDESWLDVTGSRLLFGDGKTIADTLRERVKKELGLTISVGVSFNKFFAKMGSDYKKPDATTLITRENYKALLYPLPVSDMIFVGKATEKLLKKFGIRTIGDFAGCSRRFVERQLGKSGLALLDYANGIDNTPVRLISDRPKAKSVGHSITFRRDLLGIEDVKTGVLALADEVAARLRKQGVKCQTLQVQIKSASLSVIQRQRPLPYPTNLTGDIYENAVQIITDSWNLHTPIRMLTVTGANLTEEDIAEQLSLDPAQNTFERTERRERLEQALDGVRSRYGQDSVRFGTLLEAELFSEEEDGPSK